MKFELMMDHDLSTIGKVYRFQVTPEKDEEKLFAPQTLTIIYQLGQDDSNLIRFEFAGFPDEPAVRHLMAEIKTLVESKRDSADISYYYAEQVLLIHFRGVLLSQDTFAEFFKDLQNMSLLPKTQMTSNQFVRLCFEMKTKLDQAAARQRQDLEDEVYIGAGASSPGLTHSTSAKY